VELRGILVHALSKATAQQLLGKSWVEYVEADTMAWRDLAVFHLSVWCWQPDLLLANVEFFIPDPATTGRDQSVVKPGISYPVRLRVVDRASPEGSPSPLEGLNEGFPRLRRRYCSSPLRFSSEGAR
jgi:hypothetical protein